MTYRVFVRSTRSIGVDLSVRGPGRTYEVVTPEGVRKSAVALGCPPEVVDEAVECVVLGEWATIGWNSPGDPELCVRF